MINSYSDHAFQIKVWYKEKSIKKVIRKIFPKVKAN